MNDTRQLDAALAGLLVDLNGAAAQGVQVAAELILAAALQRVPVLVGTVRDHLGIVAHQTDALAVASVEVADSAPGGVAHEAVFLEFGTSKMAAQPFMRPALQATQAAALAAFTRALQTALKDYE